MALNTQPVAADMPAPNQASAEAIGRATRDLAEVLEQIASGELPISPGTVATLEQATKVLQDLVAGAT